MPAAGHKAIPQQDPKHVNVAETADTSSHKPAVDPATLCCVTFDIRVGTFLILVFLLLMFVYSLYNDISTRQSLNVPTDILIGYILSAIAALDYVVLLVTAAKRNHKIYRPAAKFGAVVFVVGMVSTGVSMLIGSRPDLANYDPGVLVVSFALLFGLFGYWTWVLCKYGDLMEEEEQRMLGVELRAVVV